MCSWLGKYDDSYKSSKIVNDGAVQTTEKLPHLVTN
jgi:hypothetical protein